MTDEKIYFAASKELDENRQDEALWIKALTNAEGDKEKARYQYIHLRVEKEKSSKNYESEARKKYAPSDFESGAHFESRDDKRGESLQSTEKPEFETVGKASQPVIYAFKNPKFISNNLINLTFASLVISGISFAALISFGIEAAAGVGLLQILVRPFWLIFFFLWIYRTKNNVHAFGYTDLKYTPRMSVIWSLIPFANLIVPLWIVRETVAASDAMYLEDWKKGFKNLTKDVNTWWICFVAAVVIVSVIHYSSQGGAADKDSLRGGSSIILILFMVSYVKFMSVVREVRDMQLKKYEKLQNL